MSKVETVRGLISQRLSAAAAEIFELFERTIAEYEEQLCRSKEENERQKKLLDAVLKPEVRLHRADVQQLFVTHQGFLHKHKERGLILDQEDPPEPHTTPHIKEEEEDLWSHQETEQLHGLKEEETTELLLTPVPAKTEEEEEEGPQSSQLHEIQTEEILDFGSDIDYSSYGLGELTPVSECATSSDHKEPEQDARKIQNNKKNLICSVCGKCYRKKSHFFKHQKTHTGDIKRESGFNQLQKEDAAVGDVSCDAVKNLENSSECATSWEQQKELWKQTEIQKEDKPFSCSVCKGRFSTKAHLRRHMTCHSSEKPFCCSVCGKPFLLKRYLKQHMFCHSRKKPHSCSLCGKTFRRPSRLREHAANHTGEKQFCCSVCGKRFSQKRYLDQHMVCHSREKPHSCSLCGKAFLRLSGLKVHLTIHTGEKLFCCPICGKRFTRLNMFEKHTCDA